MKRIGKRSAEIDRRVAELKAEGKHWPEIADTLNAEGLTNRYGKPFNSESLKEVYLKRQRSMTTSAPSDPTTSDSPTTKASNSPTMAVSGATMDATTGPTTSAATSKAAPKPTGEGHTIKAASGATTSPDILHGPTIGSTCDPTTSGQVSLHHADLVALIRQEFVEMLGGIAVAPIPKPGRGGVGSTIKKSFSIPKDLWREFSGRFKGEAMSNHVTAALRLYLNATRDRE